MPIVVKVAPGKNKIHQNAQLWVNRQTVSPKAKVAIPIHMIATPFRGRNPCGNRHHFRRGGFPGSGAGSRSGTSFSSIPRI